MGRKEIRAVAKDKMRSLPKTKELMKEVDALASKMINMEIDSCMFFDYKGNEYAILPLLVYLDSYLDANFDAFFTYINDQTRDSILKRNRRLNDLHAALLDYTRSDAVSLFVLLTYHLLNTNGLLEEVEPIVVEGKEIFKLESKKKCDFATITKAVIDYYITIEVIQDVESIKEKIACILVRWKYVFGDFYNKTNVKELGLLHSFIVILDYFVKLQSGEEVEDLEGLLVKNNIPLSILDDINVGKVLDAYEESEKVENFYELRDKCTQTIDMFCIIGLLNTVDTSLSTLNSTHKSDLKEHKSKYLKEVNTFKKENAKLRKELQSKDKLLVKANRELDTLKNSTSEKEYKAKIEDLERRNKLLESKLESANNRVITLEDRERKNNKFVGSIDVKNAIESIIGSVEKEEVIIPKGVSLNEKIARLSKYNYLIVGCKNSMRVKFEMYFPNVTFVQEFGESNFNVNPTTDYVVLCTKLVNHSQSYRLDSQKSATKKVIPVNVTNVDLIVDEMYKAIYGDVIAEQLLS